MPSHKLQERAASGCFDGISASSRHYRTLGTILDFHHLALFRERIAVGYSHRAHESPTIVVHEVHRDGTVSISGFFLRLCANDEGCRDDELALEVLSRSSARIRSVPVLAHKPFGICVAHLLREVSLCFRCHGGFTDPQRFADSTKVLGQMHVADFIRFGAQVGVVDAEQVPDVEMGIGEFSVRQKSLRLHKLQRFR